MINNKVVTTHPLDIGNVPTFNLNTISITNNKIMTSNLLATNNDILDEKICTHKVLIVNNMCQSSDNGIKIIKFIASSLPKFDSIAPKILHLNDVIIDFALNNDFLPVELQKQIVLLSIKFAINGDEMGSKFLHFFYDLVESCL